MARITEKGPLSATIMGKAMPRWFVDNRGHRYEFHSIAEDNGEDGFDLSQLAENQCILAPGVIYERKSN